MIALAVALALVRVQRPADGDDTPAGLYRGIRPAAWAEFRHLPGVIDLAGPRSDGSFLVAAARRLFILGRDGALVPFARGAGGYQAAASDEPYLVIAAALPRAGATARSAGILPSPSPPGGTLASS